MQELHEVAQRAKNKPLADQIDTEIRPARLSRCLRSFWINSLLHFMIR
jgi:hypothetical protein